MTFVVVMQQNVKVFKGYEYTRSCKGEKGYSEMKTFSSNEDYFPIKYAGQSQNISDWTFSKNHKVNCISPIYLCWYYRGVEYALSEFSQNTCQYKYMYREKRHTSVFIHLGNNPRKN